MLKLKSLQIGWLIKLPKRKVTLKFQMSLALALVFVLFFIRENRKILIEPEAKMTDEDLHADCGVVLTGSAGRIREAFEILAQKKIRKLIVSGVYKETQLNEIFPHLSFYPEISESDIYLEKKSESTYGNALQSLALVEALKCHDILLITSQLHMYRANRFFTQAFPKHIPIKKMSVPNKKDFSYFDYFQETLKSMLYWALGLMYFSF